MASGLNQICRIWRYTYPSDDEIGGAYPSGTILYDSVECRIQSLKPTYALLEQGVEGINMYVGLVTPHTLDIRINDELQIMLPVNSAYYSGTFRIVGDPQRTSMSPSDNRGYLILNLNRVVTARTVQ